MWRGGEEADDKSCPSGECKTFCSDCGGNESPDDMNAKEGECKRVSNLNGAILDLARLTPGKLTTDEDDYYRE